MAKFPRVTGPSCTISYETRCLEVLLGLIVGVTLASWRRLHVFLPKGVG